MCVRPPLLPSLWLLPPLLPSLPVLPLLGVSLARKRRLAEISNGARPPEAGLLVFAANVWLSCLLSEYPLG